MKKNVMQFLGIIIALFAMSTTVFAGEKGTLTPGPVNKVGYTLDVLIDDVVFLKDEGDPGHGAYKAENSGNYILKYDDHPEAFQGATLYGMGRGKEWVGGKKAADVNLSAARGKVKIDKKCVTITLNHAKGKGVNYYDAPVWIVELADGRRGWYVPFGGWNIKVAEGKPIPKLIEQNKLGEALNVIIVSRERWEVLASDQKGFDLVAKQD